MPRGTGSRGYRASGSRWARRSARRPVGYPEFRAVYQVVVPVFGGYGSGHHFRRVRPDVRFGQREGGNLPCCQARQELFLLRFRSEKFKRLRRADTLVGGNPGGCCGAVTAQQMQRAAVIDLAEAQPSILLRDADSEGAYLRKRIERFLRIHVGPIDFVRVDVFFQDVFQAYKKRIADLFVFVALEGIRIE